MTVKDVKVFKSLNSNSGFFDKYTCFCYKLFKKKQFLNYNPNLKINFHKSCKILEQAHVFRCTDKQSMQGADFFIAKNYTRQELLPAIFNWQLASVKVE